MDSERISLMESQSDQQIKEERNKKLLQRINVYASFYRENPHRFAKDFLNINLRPFQQILLY